MDGIVAAMSDSLLSLSLDHARAVLRELDEEDDDVESAELRERIESVARASEAIELAAARPSDVVQIAQDAMQVRDEALALRRRSSPLLRSVAKMID